MRILYGVQGTGNGHITRARALNKHLRALGVEVDYLFSGRPRERYFDMAEFGDSSRYCQGLTFAYTAGSIRIGTTLRQNSIRRLLRDIRNLDLTPYDLVVTDFEPISAWAARRQRKPVIGVGHQYAFQFDVPKIGDSFIARNIMRHFAPADYCIGLHWHHFNAPILPPIAETHHSAQAYSPEKILVYLGFEEMDDVIQFLEPFKHHLFVVYGPFSEYQSFGNIQLKPLSREGFCADLASSNGVISNAGFELASEAIQLGKKLLVKPLKGQMEQLSNAKALEELQLGMCMETLDKRSLRDWLEKFHGKRMQFPNVAGAVAEWIQQGKWDTLPQLAERLWQDVRYLNTEPSNDPETPRDATITDPAASLSLGAAEQAEKVFAGALRQGFKG